MGYQDRPYYRDRRASNPLIWLMTGSVPLFTLFGIRVRAHATLLFCIAWELIFASTKIGMGARNAIVSMSLLFLSVLLHEFGHCFGARWMGGDADEILMWPLGGLATANPPHRPWASFFCTAAGPAVNLMICLLTGAGICLMEHSIRAIPWLPIFHPLQQYVPSNQFTYYLWWIFLVNYGLFMFNMCLVFYPFDAGRMIQEVLWWKIGYYKSMRIATMVGMVGAVVMTMIGLALLWLLLVLIAVFGFIACYRQRQMLIASGPEEFADSTDYSAAYENFSKPAPKPSRRSRRAAKRAVNLVNAERQEQQRIDRILAKVSAQGMHSLTWHERRALKKATEHQRQRDMEKVHLRRL
jgi:hypothetical protein